jgi:uncharacterized protein DUF6912
VRVYVPATLAMLSELVAERSINPVNGTAFAVTPALRESYSEGDDDELAEVALREAALASVRLLAGAVDEGSVPREREAPPVAGQVAPGGLPARRAVLVAEVDDATARPDLDDAVVRLSAPIGYDRVVAAYVDNQAAEPAVLAAIDAVDAADLGDEDAELTVGDAQDHDLAWYATQELPFLLELLQF